MRGRLQEQGTGVMQTPGEEPGPGGRAPATEPAAGGRGRRRGEMSSERQERGQSPPSPPGHCEASVFTATRGPGQRHDPTLLCDDYDLVRQEQELKSERAHAAVAQPEGWPGRRGTRVRSEGGTTVTCAQRSSCGCGVSPNTWKGEAAADRDEADREWRGKSRGSVPHV